MGSSTLLLNASFEPLHIVSWQRALQLLFQGKVEVIEEYTQEVRTVRFSIKIPAVLRLLQYLPIAQKKHVIRFSRLNVFSRDDFQCQYCGQRPSKSFLTLDHVVPIVMGGQKSWDNIVTSCIQCNQRKGGRTPSQASMRLIKRPSEPKWLPQTTLKVGVSITPQHWKLYLKSE